MKSRSIVGAVTCALLSAAPGLAAKAAPSPAGSEASIAFPNHGGIYDWQAIDRETLYVQDSARRWYLAKLLGPCLDLEFAQGVGFISSGNDVFDRFSSVLVNGQRCQVQSLVRSAPPPKKAKHHKV